MSERNFKGRTLFLNDNPIGLVETGCDAKGAHYERHWATRRAASLRQRLAANIWDVCGIRPSADRTPLAELISAWNDCHENDGGNPDDLSCRRLRIDDRRITALRIGYAADGLTKEVALKLITTLHSCNVMVDGGFELLDVHVFDGPSGYVAAADRNGRATPAENRDCRGRKVSWLCGSGGWEAIEQGAPAAG